MTETIQVSDFATFSSPEALAEAVGERFDVSAEERVSRDLIKRILKLRWIGMDDEARRVQAALQRTSGRITLFAEPCDTD